ncbi:MAG: hypothetical protein WCQ32_02710 [bacterium]
MEQNKITTWWKKVLFIGVVYLIWWPICYGSWFLISKNFFNQNADSIIISLIWLTILVIVPVISFYFFYKIIKLKTNIKTLFACLISLSVIISGFLLFLLIGFLFFLRIG